MIKFFPVVMTHDDLTSVRAYSNRPACIYVTYQPQDEILWADLQATTSSFESPSQALKFFEKEFKEHQNLLAENCFFLKDQKGEIIGTAMAWHADPPFDQNYGRLHWVVIRPDLRGKGYGKDLIAFMLFQLKRQYPMAYLTTQTTSYQAINIYLNFGFKPYIRNEEDVQAWTILREVLSHPVLEEVDLFK